MVCTCSECVCECVFLLEMYRCVRGEKIGGVAPNALHICVEGRLTLLTMWKRCVSFLERERYVVVTSCVCAWWTELKTNECEAFGEVYKRSSTRGLRCSSVWAECNGVDI